MNSKSLVSRDTESTHPRPCGVSVIICCHNSAQRLPQTLAHLMNQEVPASVRWEVIVVDNASSDDTVAVARQAWAPPSSAPLRIVHEPELGLTHARLRGLFEAAYEFIAFVDDDNWLAPEWVATALDAMSANPLVGALWGVNEGVFEVPYPEWFPAVAQLLAIGDPGQTTYDARHKVLPWGAGLVIRRSAFEMVWSAGFRFILTDRRGTALSSGGDTELCLALDVAGWRWGMDRRLKLKHYMPSARIDWSYYCRLAEAQAASTTALDPYHPAFQLERYPVRARLRRSWVFQLIRTCVRFVMTFPREAMLPWKPLPVGHPDAEAIMAFRGRIKALATARRGYSKPFQAFDAWSARVRAQTRTLDT